MVAGGALNRTERARFMPSQLLVVVVPKSTMSFMYQVATRSTGTAATARTCRHRARRTTRTTTSPTSIHSIWNVLSSSTTPA